MSFLVKSTLWVALSEILYNISGYIIHATMGRVLGPADYGRFAIIVTLTTMTIVLVGQSIPTAMSKYLSEVFEGKKELIPVIKKQTVLIQTALVGIVTVIFYICAPLIALALGDPSLTSLFRLSSLILPAFAAASFYFYYYTGLHEFKIQSFLKTNRGVWRLVFIIGLALILKSSGYALQGAILGYIAAPLMVFFIAFGIDFKISKKFKTASASVEAHCNASLQNTTKQTNRPSFDWKKLATFAWPVTIFLIAYQFLNTIDLYLVKGIMHSDAATGIYNAAYTVGTIPYNLFYALTIVLLPAVSKSTAANNQEDTKKIIGQSLRFLAMFLLPICLLMAYFSLPLINIFYSREFAAAAPVMSVYVLAEGFLTVFYVLTFILNGAGKVKIPMYASLIGLFLNTVLTYFLIKSYGLMGAASGTALMALVIMIFGLAYTHREFGYLFPFKSFLKIFFASFLMFAAAFLFPFASYFFLIYSAFLFALYLLLLWLFGEITPEDLALFQKIFQRKKR